MSVNHKSAVSRRYSKNCKFLNGFWIYVWFNIWGIGVILLIIPDALGIDLTGLIAGTILVLLSTMKIVRRVSLVVFYAFKDLPIDKKLRNILSGFFFFNIMVAASIVYYINIYFASIGTSFRSFDVFQRGATAEEDMILFFRTTAQYLAWILPIAFYAMLLTPLLLWSVREFLNRTWRFLCRYVTVFLLFQGIVFFITAAASIISQTLAETAVNGASMWYVFGSYFHFSLEAPLEEVNAIVSGNLSLFSKAGTLIGSLTGAASYLVLTDIAMEHIWEERKTRFQERLLSLFHDKATILLILMSVLCVLSSMQLYDMVSQGSTDLLAVGICLVFIVGWLATWWLFLKETKPFPYLFTFAIMYFVEEVLADPTLESDGMWGITVFIAIARILCFAVIAAMIAFYIRFVEKYEDLGSRTEEDQEVTRIFTQGNIFKVISWAAKEYKNIKG